MFSPAPRATDLSYQPLPSRPPPASSGQSMPAGTAMAGRRPRAGAFVSEAGGRYTPSPTSSYSWRSPASSTETRAQRPFDPRCTLIYTLLLWASHLMRSRVSVARSYAYCSYSPAPPSSICGKEAISLDEAAHAKRRNLVCSLEVTVGY